MRRAAGWFARCLNWCAAVKRAQPLSIGECCGSAAGRVGRQAAFKAITVSLCAVHLSQQRGGSRHTVAQAVLKEGTSFRWTSRVVDGTTGSAITVPVAPSIQTPRGCCGD